MERLEIMQYVIQEILQIVTNLMYTPHALFSPNLLFRSFSLGLYPPLRNKYPVIIDYKSQRAKYGLCPYIK